MKKFLTAILFTLVCQPALAAWQLSTNAGATTVGCIVYSVRESRRLHLRAVIWCKQIDNSVVREEVIAIGRRNQPCYSLKITNQDTIIGLTDGCLVFK